MSTVNSTFALTVEKPEGHCPIREVVGQRNIDSKKIPVFSCEGACIRGRLQEGRRSMNTTLHALKFPNIQNLLGNSITHMAGTGIVTIQPPNIRDPLLEVFEG